MTPADFLPDDRVRDAPAPDTCPGPNPAGRQQLSAVVISYNRADLIGTCLRALSFADELILIDKSSTDGTPDIAAAHADRVISVPWSPTVEETRAFAIAACAFDWILCLDDDECLSVEAVQFIEEELRRPRADVYALPVRHYILGLHSEKAYYWPEHRPKLFRRDAVELRPTVHGGVVIEPHVRTYHVPPDNGICIHHLSYRNVEQWFEKTNRYTSQPDRQSADDGTSDLAAFAHARIDAYLAQSRTDDRGGYEAAVAVQRALYDIIDRLKAWESEEGLDGAAAFQAIAERLRAEYERALPARRVEAVREIATDAPAPADAPDQTDPRERERLAHTIDTLRDTLRDVRRMSELAQRGAQQALEQGRQRVEEMRARAEQDRIRAEQTIAEQREERARAEEQHRAALAETSAQMAAAVEEKIRAAHDAAAKSRDVARNAIAEHSRSRADLKARIETLQSRAETAEAQLREMEAAARTAEERLLHIENSEFWNMTAPLRVGTEFLRRSARLQTERARLLARAVLPGHGQARGVLAASVRRRLQRGKARPALPSPGEAFALAEPAAFAPHQTAVASYPAWSRRFDTPNALDIEGMEQTAATRPPVLVLARFPAAAAHLADRTAAALERCVGVRWTAAFVFDPGCAPEILARHQTREQADTRFRAAPASSHSADAIVVLLEGGALPRPHGLRLFADALANAPEAVLAYADEDRLTDSGSPSDPWFKPAFSPVLAAQGVLLGKMVALRPEAGDTARLLRRLASPDASAASAALDIALAAGAPAAVHVPHVLFHDVMPPAKPLPLPLPALPDPLPLASILIPTRDGWHLLGPCLESLKRTDWPADRLEIIVADNASTDRKTLEGLEAAERTGFIRVLRDPRPFNYAQLNNTAARAARGELLVLLNNDTEVLDPGWLRKLAAFAMQPGAGAVGPKLLYEDGTVQHGGVVLGIQGVAGHAHLFLGATDDGYRGLANLTHEIGAVTGACLAISRAAFEEVGGLNEIFRVAFNDIVLCLDLHARGRRNVYVAEPLFTHHESKTRGFDDTPHKIAILRRETQLAWQRHAGLLRDDPFYSPNLSLEAPYQLAFAPRRRPAWRERSGRPLRVMMLSATHARGHGVAVVIDLQTRALLARGHEVILAGHRSAQDFPYEGRSVIEAHDPRSAATLAADLEADIIVAHTPPFFGVARWTGAYPPVLAYDYGEPSPDLFADAAARREVLSDKDMGLGMCARVLAISEAVAAEARVRPHGVLPLGNGHLGRWSPAAAEMRRRVRRDRGWEPLHVVLNVCRFHANERAYKGVDAYADLREALGFADPALASRSVFVLCGKGTPEDVAAMRASGLHVLANVSDEEMAGLYAAADAYVNFSRWEGYNLGIGQALAMGLPVIASDIPAHRAFGVPVTNEVSEAALLLSEAAARPAERTPRVWEWDETLAAFVAEIESVCNDQPHGAAPGPRGTEGGA
ncbi:MAG: glycosyltransferase [Acetobacteraceae bacterium]|nr:glycosyltransferase [Acetobacteraceae bacterium]